jgi:hypothetical protein
MDKINSVQAIYESVNPQNEKRFRELCSAPWALSLGRKRLKKAK